LGSKSFPNGKSWEHYNNTTAVHISDSAVNGYVKEVRSLLKNQKREDYSVCYVGTGDFICVGWRENNDEKHIIVTRDFQEMIYGGEK
jgi:hypothetical protein